MHVTRPKRPKGQDTHRYWAATRESPSRSFPLPYRTLDGTRSTVLFCSDDDGPVLAWYLLARGTSVFYALKNCCHDPQRREYRDSDQRYARGDVNTLFFARGDVDTIFFARRDVNTLFFARGDMNTLFFARGDVKSLFFATGFSPLARVTL